MRDRRLRPRGFSLVEIAIVLVVVGLVISGGLLGISPVLQANKITQTNAQMDKIDQALLIYVIQNGCLPCPATPGTTTPAGTSAPAGICTAAACTSTQGLVPWASIGLSKSDVIDPYGSFIDYAPAAGLNTSNTSMVRVPPNTYGSPPTSTLTVQDAAGNVQANAASQVAYVLVSHGPDGSGGFAASNSSQQRTDPNGSGLQTDNTAVTNGAGGFKPSAAGFFVLDTPKTQSYANGYFDDIVRFKTQAVIIQSCGTDACGNPA